MRNGQTESLFDEPDHCTIELHVKLANGRVDQAAYGNARRFALPEPKARMLWLVKLAYGSGEAIDNTLQTTTNKMCMIWAVRTKVLPAATKQQMCMIWAVYETLPSRRCNKSLPSRYVKLHVL